ncbi:MAG: hypothetical protein ACQEXJ_24375 [Myxococcota bacterium]
MGEDAGRERLAGAIADLLLEGVDGRALEQGRADARELAADWHREAGADDDRDEVLEVLREDLGEAASGRDRDGRLRLLRTEVLDRRIRALGRETLRLGKAVVDGEIGGEAAREQGEALLERVRAIEEELDEALDERREALERDLREASLEALHAAAGGAMSRRLSRYAQERRGRAEGS